MKKSNDYLHKDEMIRFLIDFLAGWCFSKSKVTFNKREIYQMIENLKGDYDKISWRKKTLEGWTYKGWQRDFNDGQEKGDNFYFNYPEIVPLTCKKKIWKSPIRIKITMEEIYRR